jgi:hypothetical protein
MFKIGDLVETTAAHDEKFVDSKYGHAFKEAEVIGLENDLVIIKQGKREAVLNASWLQHSR